MTSQAERLYYRPNAVYPTFGVFLRFTPLKQSAPRFNFLKPEVLQFRDVVSSPQTPQGGGGGPFLFQLKYKIERRWDLLSVKWGISPVRSLLLFYFLKPGVEFYFPKSRNFEILEIRNFGNNFGPPTTTGRGFCVHM